MAISKVGLGWSVGERDYANLHTWEAAKYLSTEFEEAICKGQITTTIISFNRGFSGGILIRGDVQYTGNNENDLPFSNFRIIMARVNGVIQDVRVNETAVGRQAIAAEADGAILQRIRASLSYQSGVNVGSISANRGAIVRNCVGSVIGDNNMLLSTTSLGVATVENCIFFSTGGMQGFSRNETAIHTIRNNFTFGSQRDYLVNGASSTINCASGDGTGNFTGYTSAELVDFAGGDYRIKSTSDLKALGIGAFFEEGGVASNDIAISSLAKLPTSSVSLNNLKPNYSATISSSAKLPVSSVLLDSVAPEFVLSVISNALLPISSVALDNEAPSNTLSISSSAFLPTSSVSLNNEAPSNSLSISSAALLPTSTVLLARDLPVYSSNISSLAKLPTSSVVLNDTKPEFSSTVNSFALLPTSVVSLDRLDPSNSISINSFTLLPTSSVALDKTNPTGITVVSFTPLPTSSVVLDNQSVNLVTITSSAKLPTSSVSLDSTVPEYSVQIVGNAPLPTSIVRLSNGNVIYVIGEGNSVTIRSKSNFVQTKSKSNFIKVR